MIGQMIGQGMQALLPAVVVTVGAVLLISQIAFRRRTDIAWLLTCLTLLLGLGAIVPALELAPAEVTPLMVSDRYSLFFSALILSAGLVTALLSRDYLAHRPGENEEYFLLLLLSILGALVLASATHLASFLLGLELLSVALYPMIAYPERDHLPLEAATKYLVLSGAGSAILLFGFALLYAALGTLSFAELGGRIIGAMAAGQGHLILAGAAMAFAGIAFKLSLAPFHMWTPDVYQGAPAPVTGFLATISKGAVFAALLRLFLTADLFRYEGLMMAITVVAIVSMLAGNLLALRQTNIKRLLAYSSIAHLGYLLITLAVCGALPDGHLAIEAAGYYLVAYVTTTLAAFALVSIISSDADGAEHDEIDQLTGLFWRSPLLATLFTIALLSLAGIPLTAGFLGKFYLFTSGAAGELWALLAALVIGSGIGIYYYLRVVYAMTLAPDAAAAPGAGRPRPSVVSMCVVLALILLMIVFGVAPQPLMGYLGGISV